MSASPYGSLGVGGSSRRNSRLGPDEARSRRSSMLRPGEDDMEEDEMIDPELRLRTVRTAASAIAVSIHNEARANRTRRFLGLGRRTDRDPETKRSSIRGPKRRFSGKTPAAQAAGEAEIEAPVPPPGPEPKASSSGPPGTRRNVYVNWPLPADELYNDDPIARFSRNKVRTSKYTILTFLPKNIIFEQFRRVANMYFLLLVVLQVFPIFGATTPQIAMLPLVAILTLTAIKDGIEDYRRASLDEEVNNSAATKLGGWKNVNQPRDPRTLFERLLGYSNPNDKTSKGVRKLREKEAKEGKEIVLQKTAPALDDGADEEDVSADQRQSYAMDDIQSIDSHGASEPRLGGNHPDLGYLGQGGGRNRSTSIGSYQPSVATSGPSRRSIGVVDWDRSSAGTAKWERTLWKKLEVGDIVLLRDDEQVPADIAVLSTADADGVCYVETKNLDGETNLKVRKSLRGTANINSEEDVEHARFMVDAEPPTANLYTFNAVLKYSSREPSPDGGPLHPASTEASHGSTGSAAWKDKIEPITINELLLRGCTIRNSGWIIGLVLFTGRDTKIMMNGGDTPSKRSKIEVETNFNVIMNFIILMGLCVATAVGYGVVEHQTGRSFNVFEEGSQPSNNYVVNALVIFASGLIVFQNIVPISLYISIEIVKTIQAIFIFQDIEMYYEELDTPCVPKTWNISDDLGQIEYIFSDKTGTLTMNEMNFKKCSVNGVTYGEGVTEAMLGAAKREGRELPDMEAQKELEAESLRIMLDRMRKGWKNRYLQEDKVTLIAPDLAAQLADRSSPHRTPLIEFFRALAICHGVVADKDPDNAFLIDYKAESPDEAALVGAARDAGFAFLHKNNHHLDIEVLGQAERWTPLRVLEFNSTRKRMSVIVRSPEGRLIMYSKGADSVIMARLRKDHDQQIIASTQHDLETMANAGLRTLLVGYRYLDEQEYFDWSRTYDAASSALRDRDEEMEKACETIEQDLIILGATALEDRLQAGVPDTIEQLHQAGIKLWILTGDKVQTAIEIAYSCNLLTNDMEIFILSAETEDGARLQIEGALNKIASERGPPAVGKQKIAGAAPSSTGFAVVIDGDTLRFALDSGLKDLFLSLSTQCETVVCCRVSPAQKAATVRLVKVGMKAMTLSIGDGANDVAMIQEANIGVGLFGHEGSQAAMSADYAFGQFRFLTRLLLVHGHWSYVRVAEMHANFFYKNLVWTGTLFWYCIFNEWEATYLFEYTFILLYNLIFTSLPVIVLGAFDQDVNATALLAFPQLYERGIRGLEYTRTKFWMYTVDGVYQSAVCFFIPYFVYAGGRTWASDGLDTSSMYELGTTVAVSAIATANLFVGLNSRYWTAITWVVITVSTLLCFIWVAIYSMFSTFFYDYEVVILFPSVNFWATVIIVLVLSIGPHYLFRSMKGFFWPLDKDIIREAWVSGDLKERLGIAHRSKKRKSRPTDLELHPALHASQSQRLRSSVVSEAGDSDHGGAAYRPTLAAVKSPLKESFSSAADDLQEPIVVPPIQYHYARSTPPPQNDRGTYPFGSGPYQIDSQAPPATAYGQSPLWAASSTHALDPSQADSQQSWATAEDGQAWEASPRLDRAPSPYDEDGGDDLSKHRGGFAY